MTLKTKVLATASLCAALALRIWSGAGRETEVTAPVRAAANVSPSERERRIEGSVVTEDGSPVAGAEILLSSSQRRPLVAARSAADGTFVLRAVEPSASAAVFASNAWHPFHRGAPKTTPDPRTGAFEIGPLPAGTWNLAEFIPPLDDASLGLRVQMHDTSGAAVVHERLWRFGGGLGSGLSPGDGCGEAPTRRDDARDRLTGRRAES